MFRPLLAGVLLSFALAGTASATITIIAAPPFPADPIETVISTGISSTGVGVGVTSLGDARLVASLGPGPGLAQSAAGMPLTVGSISGGTFGQITAARPGGFVPNVPAPGFTALKFTIEHLQHRTWISSFYHPPLAVGSPGLASIFWPARTPSTS